MCVCKERGFPSSVGCVYSASIEQWSLKKIHETGAAPRCIIILLIYWLFRRPTARWGHRHQREAPLRTGPARRVVQNGETRPHPATRQLQRQQSCFPHATLCPPQNYDQGDDNHNQTGSFVIHRQRIGDEFTTMDGIHENHAPIPTPPPPHLFPLPPSLKWINRSFNHEVSIRYFHMWFFQLGQAIETRI